MFQYSFGKYLSTLLQQELLVNCQVYINGGSNRNYTLDIFNLSVQRIGSKEMVYERMKDQELPIIHLKEKHFHYDTALIKPLKKYALNIPEKEEFHVMISGFWQSCKYFQGIESVLSNDFTFRNPLHGKWKTLEEQITRRQSVMLNVRRGDYLEKLDFHGVVDIDYINRAIKTIRQQLSRPFFYVFSDDIPWCKEHIKDKHLFFVDESYYDPAFQYYLQLMTRCKHFIIPNSSFGWWAAWMARNKRKMVIAPKKWFATPILNTKDLLPKTWIKL
ncbi:alpha-1,2-fucosyltransferase [Chitinophaga sp. 22321]|uniref:Alpha-1,2-fucosyltransferase n=2 Tax=Chitinophaga hostae TaxID=2831022 RepID=A0ABS5IYU8_9BACT|nr:alpha-1,2-fucosyltransferase [Chitinophaga hostae]MBS0028139.1 alpha-1,2-fucosyltransferase [Chitinophaga hostae]